MGIHAHVKTSKKRPLESAHDQRTSILSDPQIISHLQEKTIGNCWTRFRPNEPASSLLFWSPEESRRREHPQGHPEK